MANKSIKLNFIYNLTYQILMLISPFIVAPYVSRVLGVDGIGLYSYSNSILSYFLLFAVLGSTTYAQRVIGYSQTDVEERSRKFWEIFFFRVTTVSITAVPYAILILFAIPHNQRIIYLILAINLVNVVLDISWFMQGMEEFAKTVFINIFFKILSIVSIFVFVKTPDDLWIYVLSMAMFTICGSGALWVFLPKYLCKVKGIKPFKEIKIVLQMFLPTIAIQVYTVLDKSMIGWFASSYTENGYYEQAEKVVKMALTAVTALGIVMIPRISRKFKEGDMEQVHSYLYKSYRFVWMMSIPVMFGLIVISSTFVPVFFGEGYEQCVLLIQILSPLVIFIGLSNVTGMQYFVPIGKQNILTLTVVVGAVVNLILNLIFIPFYYAFGACIASAVAEFSVTLAGFIYCLKKKCFSLRPVFLCAWKYWIAGVIMFVSLFFIKMCLPIEIWSLVVIILCGCFIYFLALIFLRDSLIIDTISRGLTLIKNCFNKKDGKAS